jgi:DNA phosphorothioation-associated putative methyltransferase
MADDLKDSQTESTVYGIEETTEIARHRTAIRRRELSRPVRTAIEDQLITNSTTVLDYGCGQGDDIRNLANLGVRCIGWDPQYHPEAAMCPSDVVNLGYVVNEIEDAEERATVLKSVWEYARHTLIVSARADGAPEIHGESPFHDGCLTKFGTFQKFFETGRAT